MDIRIFFLVMTNAHTNITLGAAAIVMTSLFGIFLSQTVLTTPQDLRKSAAPPAQEVLPAKSQVAQPEATGTCPFNTNIDGAAGVDLDDYRLFVQNVLKEGVAIPGDIDCNGVVDISDYSYLVKDVHKQ